ncbi:MAG TPA: hypothetical protein VM733_08355 [Thermoanaerobaculia bacterium]|nr:hypothetical protein [Thermoanaerobaculia bacterium]
MPERRHQGRVDGTDRRSFPRPPLWLNLLLLILGIGGIVYARHHREQVSKQFASVIAEEARTPADVKKLKSEIADLDLNRGQLQKELDGRAKFLASLKSEDFYLSIDTKARKIRFYYGDTVLREDDVQIGESKEIAAGDKRWTFIPLKGAFPVEAKLVSYAWPVPGWAYALRNEPIPAQQRVVPEGLGKYVMFLPNGYAIHTQPGADSPLQGPKPGSYMVSEDMMRAIWPRIHTGKTAVYIF